MRDRILDRLAYLADVLIACDCLATRDNIASAALFVAVSNHSFIPLSEGSP